MDRCVLDLDPSRLRELKARMEGFGIEISLSFCFWRNLQRCSIGTSFEYPPLYKVVAKDIELAK